MNRGSFPKYNFLGIRHSGTLVEIWTNHKDTRIVIHNNNYTCSFCLNGHFSLVK